MIELICSIERRETPTTMTTSSCGRPLLMLELLFLLLVAVVSVVHSFQTAFIQLSATPPSKRFHERQRHLNHYNNIVGYSTTTIGGGMSSSSSSKDDQQSTTKSKKRLFSFEEARKIARGHGFISRTEFVEYSCPGAYQLPKNADQVYSEKWNGWDDFLGIPLQYQEGRQVAHSLKLSCKQQYLELMESKAIDDNDKACRLPYRPDLKYKDQWISWEDWLGAHDTAGSTKNSLLK